MALIKRQQDKVLMFFYDLALIFISVLLTDWILLNRFNILFHNWYYLFLLVLSKLIIFSLCKLYHRIWRYVGIYDLVLISKAIIAGFFLDFLFFSLIFEETLIIILKLVLVDALFLFLLISLSRFLPRLLLYLKVKNQSLLAAKRVIFVGFDESVKLFLHYIVSRPEIGYIPLGIITESKIKASSFLGINIIGEFKELAKIIKEKSVEQVLLSEYCLNNDKLKQIIEICNQAHVELKILPNLGDITALAERRFLPREVRAEDLLRRPLNFISRQKLIPHFIGKRILISGAAGSIGSLLAKELRKLYPAELILIDNDEYGIFRLKEKFNHSSSININYHIADIRDRSRMDFYFRYYKPEIVFHAAAYKHVSLMDENPVEAITNNVLGTINLALAALSNKVEKFIFISTDKAVEPRSVMGATKSLGEVLMQALDRKNSTQFISVRFGNVVGSRGSVVPIFEERIKQSLPLIINHPEAKRYFMTGEEAVYLMLQATWIGKGGEVFILDMGRQLKILDLAYEILKLYNLQAGKDIDIKFGKLAKGEKLAESLYEAHEMKLPTQCSNIYIAQSYLEVDEKLSLALKRLKGLALVRCSEKERQYLLKILSKVEEEVLFIFELAKEEIER